MSTTLIGRWRSYKVLKAGAERKDDSQLYKFGSDGKTTHAHKKANTWHTSPRPMRWNLVNNQLIIDPYGAQDTDPEDYLFIKIISPDEISIEGWGETYFLRRMVDR